MLAILHGFFCLSVEYLEKKIVSASTESLAVLSAALVVDLPVMFLARLYNI